MHINKTKLSLSRS